jgi:hypothetical protein
MSLRGRSASFWIAAAAAAAAAIGAVLLLTRGDEKESLEAALAYVPADAPYAVEVETDIGDDQYEDFARTAGAELLGDTLPSLPPGASLLGGGGGLEGAVAALLLSQGINYDGQVKPLLGGELVVASAAPPTLDRFGFQEETIAALEVGDPGAARSLLEDLGFRRAGEHRGAELWTDGEARPADAELAVDDDVILFAEGDGQLQAAIDRARDGAGATVDEFEEALEDTPGDAVIRIHARPQRFLEVPELAPLAELPWPAALRSVGMSVAFRGDEAQAELVARTGPDGLSADDLPFPEDSGEPGLVERPGEVASGSLDQSYTTAFLVRAARLLFADSQFIRDVEAVERDLGIDFEAEVLKQFAGPSASTVTLEGDFGARSTVADPAAMRELLPRLAPRLPQLAKSLDSLGTEGLLALLFIAPDAPVATTPSGAETATPLGGGPESEEEELLYVIKGPRNPRLTPIVNLPKQVVLGMIGDVFVVASDRRRAREMAAAEPEPVEGLSGASVLRAEELGEVPSQIAFAVGLPVDGVRGAEASVEASTNSVRAELSLSYGD